MVRQHPSDVPAQLEQYIMVTAATVTIDGKDVTAFRDLDTYVSHFVSMQHGKGGLRVGRITGVNAHLVLVLGLVSSAQWPHGLVR